MRVPLTVVNAGTLDPTVIGDIELDGAVLDVTRFVHGLELRLAPIVEAAPSDIEANRLRGFVVSVGDAR